jgi:putative membrane-bound dehydrogenase-like protein
MKPAITRTLRAAGFVAAVLASLVLSNATPGATLADQALTVPPGFEIRRVAAPTLVQRPIVADFDEQGRLYVADSSGSNDKVEKQLAEKPHRIVRLEDRDDDGTFETSTVFADRMMLPQGAMWFDGSLYVAAAPSIWKLTDTDGDGVADRREEWFQGKTLTGCANDLHGPYLGPDGWIYWTKGAFAQQTYDRPGKPPFVTSAAHIFRRRPGDSTVEAVMTGGMDNPVEVAFTPTGERILTATFLEHPQLGRRDALVHAVYGGVYGKPHAVIDGHPRTGDLMPELSQLGPAAPSGLTRYASRVFGLDYRDNFFVAQFNMQKVTRHVLETSGATFKSRDSDFLVSTNRDFHPTDVLEDADGSLIVIDTGAWYKLCCPSSQLAKPDVLGAIYRITRKGAPRPHDPRGRGLSWDTMSAPQLTRLLDDSRPAVRNQAIQRLAKQGTPAVSALDVVLKGAPTVEARRNAVWALTRMTASTARAAVRVALDDRDPTVRQAALHSVALWRDADALPQTRAALASRLPAVQRAAAEAIGRIGDARAVPDLIAAAGLPLDRTLEHSVTYALIEVADAAATRAGLDADTSRAKRAALIALDQMGGETLSPDVVIPLLDSPRALIKETAWWVAGHHPEWGGRLAEFFQRRLSLTRLDTTQSEDLQQKLMQFGQNPAIQALLARTVGGAASPGARVIALRAMARTSAKHVPEVWVAPLVTALTSGEPETTRSAVAVARAMPPDKDGAATLNGALLRVARDAATPAETRLDALAAIDGGLSVVEPALFDLLRASLEAGRPAPIRVAAAGILANAALDREQLWALAGLLGTSGPLELPRLLPAFDRGSDEALGLEMLSALSQAKARASVRAEVLRPRLMKYPPSVQQRGEALLASLTEDSAKQLKRLEDLLVAVRDGDPRRGQFLFNGPKAACSACHAIGYQGGKLGPDLTSIGQIRSERDLLEAIVFPNASFPRGYESIVVTTTSGRVYSGLLRSDLPDEVVVATGARDEARIPKQTIADMQPGTASLMPSGFGDQLTRQELADLLAFLKGTRWGANE